MKYTLTVSVVCALIFSIECGEHILRLQEGVHAGTTLIGVEEGSSVLIRCEHPTGNVAALRWLHGGTAVVEKDASYIQIINFQNDKDDGVYECSAPGMSASYRLKLEKQHILPDGFRYCFGEEMAKCEHADVCQVDISSKITSCVCEQGWTGESCNVIDTVRSHSIKIPQDCAYWAQALTCAAFFVVVGLLFTCLHKYKVRNPRHNITYQKHKQDKPAMVTADYKPIRPVQETVQPKINDVADVV